MAYLLDTNILSEIRNPQKANPAVLTWFSAHRADRMYISAISIGEIKKGIENLRKKSPQQCPAFERWLDHLLRDYADDIVPICTSIMDTWGEMMAQRTLTALDSLIAATALNMNLTLVTRNEKDFTGVGIKVENPFSL